MNKFGMKIMTFLSAFVLLTVVLAGGAKGELEDKTEEIGPYWDEPVIFSYEPDVVEDFTAAASVSESNITISNTTADDYSGGVQTIQEIDGDRSLYAYNNTYSSSDDFTGGTDDQMQTFWMRDADYSAHGVEFDYRWYNVSTRASMELYSHNGTESPNGLAPSEKRISVSFYGNGTIRVRGILADGEQLSYIYNRTAGNFHIASGRDFDSADGLEFWVYIIDKSDNEAWLYSLLDTSYLSDPEANDGSDAFTIQHETVMSDGEVAKVAYDDFRFFDEDISSDEITESTSSTGKLLAELLPAILSIAMIAMVAGFVKKIK